MSIDKTTNLQFGTIEGSASKGGWQANCSFANSQALVEYGRHAQLFVKAEGGGGWQPNERLALDGSILPNTLTADRKQSNLDVLVSTSDVFLSNAGLQGIYFTNILFTNPHQIQNLNLGKIIRHIVKEHTNITTYTPGGWVDISGIDTIFSTSVDVYTVRQSNSIWSTIEDIASNEFYVRYFTKQDKLIYEPHPQFKSTLPPPVFNLNQNNMVGNIEVTYRNDLKVDQVQAYGLTDTGQILTAFYPAQVGTEGRRQKFTNLRCNSQARLNLLAERAFKYLNRDINFKCTIGGPWGAYLELYDRVSVTYAGTDRNGVTINWNNKKFWIDQIRINRVGSFAATTELILEEENL